MEAVPLGEMRSAAEQLARTFTDTWNSRNGAAYGEAYWPDAELVDPTGQLWDSRGDCDHARPPVERSGSEHAGFRNGKACSANRH